MTYYTKKQAILKIREAIKETEGREYTPSYIAFMMKREDNKWVVETRRGNRYELDA